MMNRLRDSISILKFATALMLVYLALFFVRAERLARIAPSSGTISAPKGYAKHVTAGLRRASALVPMATCLPQAILARILLARLGYHAAIHIGVKTVDGEFAAHAWTMSGDNIVSGGPMAAVEEFKVIKVLD